MEVYFDENISHRLANAMKELSEGQDWDIQVFATKQIDGFKGATDLQITEYVASRGGVIITQDRDFKSQRAITELCKKYKVGIFLLSLSKGECSYWEMVRLLINSWDDIVNVMQTQTKPYWYKVTRNKGRYKVSKLY